jgi:hypothetical protein
MNALARVGKSRDAWKQKATSRAREGRYLRRQLAKSRARVRELELRVETLEVARSGARAAPKAATESAPLVDLADAAAIRTLSVLLVVQAVVSFRSVPRILQLTRPGSWTPHFSSVINWTLRVGLAALQAVCPIAEPWVAIVDTTIDVCFSKLLVVLRLPLAALERRGSAVTLADCEVICLKISPTWTGESVGQALGEAFAKAGTPVAILKDAGADLAKGVTLWQATAGQPPVKTIEDVGHVAANALKREFAETKGFKRFLEYVYAAAGRLWQSDLAFLAPRRPRTKGRFQSITRLARWAKKLKPLIGGAGRVDDETIAGRLRRLAGGLAPHQAFLSRFILASEVVERCLEILKNRGMNQASYRQIIVELERLPKASHTRQRLSRWARRQLNIQARLGVGQTPLPVSTDIIESLFGKLKIILARNPKAEFNRLSLVVPCLCGARTEATVAAALRDVSHRDLERWVRENVPPTSHQARLRFGRGEMRPDWVPKTAQSP